MLKGKSISKKLKSKNARILRRERVMGDTQLRSKILK
jgi:hypothetical protein